MEDFGSLIIFEQGDFAQGIKLIYKKMLQSRGIPQNIVTDLVIEKLATEKKNEIEEEFRNAGFPNKILALFSLNKKSNVVKMCKTTFLTKNDLAYAVFNANTAGFSHFFKRKYFIPDAQKHTIEEKEAFYNNGIGEYKTKKAKTFYNKLIAQYIQRTVLTAHLFVKNREWHLFYFTYRDAYVKVKNHFEEGPHLHYTSYLFKNISVETVMNMLENGEVKINNVHLKYKDEEN